MKSLKRVSTYLTFDFINALAWFWAIVLIINTASYILMRIFGQNFFGISMSTGGLFGDSTRYISVAAGNIMTILIFFIVYSYIIYYENFPLAVGFSIIRKDFFKATMMSNFLLALIFAVVQGIIMKLDIIMINVLGMEPYVKLGIFNTSTDSLLYIIFSLFVLFISVTSIFNLLAVLNYKLGYKIWIGIGIVSLLSLTFIGATFLSFINAMLTQRIGVPQLFLLGMMIIFTHFISYLVIINTNIKNKLV